MLSGEGNEDGEKIAKKQLCTYSTLFCTFLSRCFARLQREASRNFLVHVLWRKCRTCSCLLFFSLPLIFTLIAASNSHCLSAATKFSCCSSREKRSPLILCSSSLSLFFSLSFASLSLTFSFSLSFSFCVFQICGHGRSLTWQLIYGWYILASSYAISRQNNLELHLGCHACRLSYFKLVCL